MSSRIRQLLGPIPAAAAPGHASIERIRHDIGDTHPMPLKFTLFAARSDGDCQPLESFRSESAWQDIPLRRVLLSLSMHGAFPEPVDWTIAPRSALGDATYRDYAALTSQWLDSPGAEKLSSPIDRAI